MIVTTSCKFLGFPDEEEQEIFMDELLETLLIYTEKHPDTSYTLTSNGQGVELKVTKLNECAN